jgi:neural Wiskott-Aldrich syndrome protein
MSEAFADERGRAPQSANLAASLQRAAIYAEEQGHRLITLEHLLLALTEDPDAIAVLDIAGLDLDDLRNDTASLVGGIDDRVPLDSQIPPQASGELIRVIDAASSAASSKRRTIDGAIVLAALIGEGNSAAAELLKVRGLTFDAAIRTMRMKPLSAASQMPAPAPRPRSQRQDPIPRSQQRPPLADANASQPSMPWQRGAPAVDRRIQPTDAVPRSRALPNLPPERPSRVRDPGQDRYGGPAPERSRVGASDRGLRGVVEPGYDAPPPANSPYDVGSVDDVPRTGRRRPSDAVQAPSAGRAPQRRPESRSEPRSEHGANPPRRSGKSKRGENSGPLLVTAASRMQRGETETIEVRVALRALAALDGVPEGGGAYRDRPFVTRAVTVRLRTDDDAVIETDAPETQWIESAIGLQEEDLGSWYWTIVPQRAGKLPLIFSLSSRTVGADGLTAETTLPDHFVEVRVTGTPVRTMLRICSWFALIVGALAAGALAEHVFRMVDRLLK